MNNKKYKIVNELNEEKEQGTNIPRIIFEYGILAIICLMTFLIAKYIVITNIKGEKRPIDTSQRL